MVRPEKIKVLLACEESQAVCIEFRRLEFQAFSCDILPCSGGHPEWHIQDDVMNVLRHDIIDSSRCEWDCVIAFPPCTDLAVSGAAWFEQKRKDGRQQKSIMFFEFFTHLKNRFIAVENPIGIMSNLYRKPDQIIQPYQFGHPESKATCLWLKDLPKLQDVNNVKELWKSLPRNQAQRIHYLPPSKDRGKLRSKTYDGIAKAMATQWGEYLINNL